MSLKHLPIPQLNNMELDKDFKELPNHPILPYPTSKILSIGISGSGKTSLIYSMMRAYQNEGRKPYYDIVYVFSGTKDSNRAWKTIKNVVVFNDYTTGKLKKICNDIAKEQEMRMKIEKKPLKIFMIFDDLVGAKLFNKSGSGTGIIEHLSATCRHNLVGYAIMVQRYKNASFETRANNVDVLTIGKITPEELSAIAKEHSGFYLTKTQFKKLYTDIMDTSPYAYLVIDYNEKDHKRRFRNTFNHFIVLEPKNEPVLDDDSDDEEDDEEDE